MKEKNRTVAMVLTLLLGTTGINWCYLNKDTMGLIQFFLTLIGAMTSPLGWVGIVILMAAILIPIVFYVYLIQIGEEEFYKKYNHKSITIR